MRPSAEKFYPPEDNTDGKPDFVDPSFLTAEAANQDSLEATDGLEVAEFNKLNGYLNQAESTLAAGDHWEAAMRVEEARAGFLGDIVNSVLSKERYDELSDSYRGIAVQVYGATESGDILESARRTFFDNHAEAVLEDIEQQQTLGEVSADSFERLVQFIDNEKIMNAYLTPEIRDRVMAMYEPLKRLMNR